MNLLFITHYYAPDSGAAANRLTRLARLLQQRGHSVTVLTTLPHYPTGRVPERYRRRFTVVEERDGVRVIQVWLWTTRSGKISRRLLSQLSFMLTLALRGLFVQRPDVLFIENQPIFTGLAGWFISRMKRRRYVLNVSDYWPEYLYVSGTVRKESVVYRIFESLANLTQQSAHALTVMLPQMRQTIRTRLPEPPPIHLVQNAVDLQQFRPGLDDRAFREKHSLGTATLVTFLGVLGTHIDLPTMLEAARHFQGREEVRFLFVGTGAQKEALQAALQREEFAHCRWIEWLDSSEMPAFWAASHVNYWALHDNELDRIRFQAKLYEALATGTPAVIAVQGYMSEVLREHDMGVTVSSYDAAGLAAEIERLLNDEAHYRAISANARAYAEAHFDPQRVADAYDALLRQAAQHGRTSDTKGQ